ncbi:VOC family protein [Arenibacter sp. GZD96]|uniref:VOC family protein n=1 Tax=Aurantibrevibacter litoralis TaxID=3106030 RepID=UPI002AFEDD72|nr:VOC family protein [Arenibacter sp. GZD-96]MEA1786499.1 VOC family protein [Arenibacter sp. GZD-96]
MIFEHFAVNVDKVRERVQWYVENIGLKVVSAQPEAPHMTFLADTSGRVVLEVYHRADAPLTDFSQQHPLVFHLAFVSEKAQADSHRLQQQGATFFEEIRKEDGSCLVMLRDPWGMPLQLCQRTHKW